MSIDERVEALTMTMELVAADLRELTAHMGTLTSAMTELARVSRGHELRLKNIEGE